MTDDAVLPRIDVFPYSHLVGDLMSVPLVGAPAATILADAAAMMAAQGVSALVLRDGEARPAGILTERDVLRALGDQGAAALKQTLGELASKPVRTIRADAYLYVALGRMDRLGVKHLVAVDEAGRGVGMLTMRALLKLRSGSALAIGDGIASATGVEALADLRGRSFALGQSLAAEGVPPHGIAAVLSSVLEDLTAAAARLAEAAMAADPAWGPPPARWCVLLLGSGGRRESLFGPDQDNAMIHDGSATDDAWFAEAGERIADTLDGIGVPYCRGGIMAMNGAWRHDRDGWRRQVAHWIASADGKDLLDLECFVDFRPVYGDLGLGRALAADVIAQAAASERLLQAMRASVAAMRPGLDLLGRFRTREGRLDLKLTGLLPLVSTARLFALRHGIAATGTPARLRGAAAAGALQADEAEDLVGHHALMLRLLIDQQSADLRAGLPLSSAIEPGRLARRDRALLKAAMHAVADFRELLESPAALS